MLELRRLRLLYELSHRGTIAAVGEALHLSPSGVSQQLSQLEGEVGVPLLERVGRGVRLTEQALVLVNHTEAILGRLEQADADVASFMHVPRGTIRIAAFQTAMLALMPRLLDEIARFDDLRVELTQAEPEFAVPALLARDFDLVIGEEYPGDPVLPDARIDRVDLVREPVRLFTGDPSVSDLAGARERPWVMEPVGTASRRWATSLCRAAGFDPVVRFESDDMVTHVELIRSGHAAGLLPDLLWRRRAVVGAGYELPGQVRTIFSAVRQGSNAHPSIRAVRIALGELVQALDRQSDPPGAVIRTDCPAIDPVPPSA